MLTRGGRKKERQREGWGREGEYHLNTKTNGFFLSIKLRKVFFYPFPVQTSEANIKFRFAEERTYLQRSARGEFAERKGVEGGEGGGAKREGERERER